MLAHMNNVDKSACEGALLGEQLMGETEWIQPPMMDAHFSKILEIT
jgi:hypothetical protein